MSKSFSKSSRDNFEGKKKKQVNGKYSDEISDYSLPSNMRVKIKLNKKK